MLLRSLQSIATVVLFGSGTVATSSSSSMTDEESSFMSERETVYEDRRRRIAAECDKLPSRTLLKKTVPPPDTLDSFVVHEKRHQVTFCMIPTVASTTWSRRLLDLSGQVGSRPKHEVHHALAYADSLQTNVTEEEDYMTAFGPDATSLVIVRHPLGRLVSAYLDKVGSGHVKLKKGPTGLMRRFFTENNLRFVHIPKASARSQQVTPMAPGDFIRFTLAQPNIHWNPQHTYCPVCRVNFTIYSKLEQELSQDTRYFYLKLGLGRESSDVRLRLNSSKNTDRENGRFWSRVSPAVVARVLLKYRNDFRLFGYSAEDYFKRIGLSQLYKEALMEEHHLSMR